MSCPIPAGFHALPLPIVQLSLAAVLKCGQSFRWSIFPLSSGPVPPSHPTHEYRLCLRDRVVCLRQSPDTLYYSTVLPTRDQHASSTIFEEEKVRKETLDWIRDYFQLDVDLLHLYNDWSQRDPVFKSFRDRFEGIRMLRQDPWENLISFICSSNNNISRITKMVTSLCEHFSPPLLSLPPPELYSDSSASSLLSPPATPLSERPLSQSQQQEDMSTERSLRTYHPFPSPAALASSSVASILRSLGFGYRAEYVQKTAQMLSEAHPPKSEDDDSAERYLRTLRDMSTGEAREALLGFMGVGRKVADCVLLMSLDKKEVVPVDTHVHQIAMRYYGVSSGSKARSNGKIPMTPKIYDQVNAKLAEVWGDYAGWAHSVLFTADLKSFSTYGLDIPTPVPASSVSDLFTGLPTPPITPSPSPTKSRGKRRKAAVLVPETSISAKEESTDEIIQDDSSLSLAERVKKRRRVTILAKR
ncbi:DNA glycosylase [Heliocybe sulcata]|uniref:DNA-(apurinic or apyrimidinic site) lyase n=1 Tax=Heliocybe sulcata TaxID=5364 RepID=A0A5C3NDJ3_9AGAM|nr:DNA glycosylase [Heliocybe sulcata]